MIAKYPKDETGREWLWPAFEAPTEAEILGTPAKFGATAYNDPNMLLKTFDSEDFNFGSGDFCVAGFAILPSAGFGTGESLYKMIWQIYEDHYFPRDGYFTGISAVITGNSTDGGMLIWKFANYAQTELHSLTAALSGSLFDDQYHFLTFARYGDVFSMYVDGIRVAYNTFPITLAYNNWDMYYWFKSFTPA